MSGGSRWRTTTRNDQLGVVHFHAEVTGHSRPIDHRTFNDVQPDEPCEIVHRQEPGAEPFWWRESKPTAGDLRGSFGTRGRGVRRLRGDTISARRFAQLRPERSILVREHQLVCGELTRLLTCDEFESIDEQGTEHGLSARGPWRCEARGSIAARVGLDIVAIGVDPAREPGCRSSRSRTARSTTSPTCWTGEPRQFLEPADRGGGRGVGEPSDWASGS